MSATPAKPRRCALCPILPLLVLAVLAGRGASAGDARVVPLHAGDRVAINVFGEDDLTLSVLIDDRGTISYPLLGELAVAGLTPAGLAELLVERLRGPFLVDPKVTVNVEAYRKLFVTGQVKRPGGYPYAPGLTARKAVSLAGGFTDRAARGKVFLVPEAAPEKEQRIDLDTEIGPGDTLIVKESFF